MHIAARVAAEPALESVHSAGIGDGQRLEDHRIVGAEERRIDADAEAQRHHGQQREAGVAAHRAQGVAYVRQEAIEVQERARFAVDLLNLGYAAEGAAGGQARVGGGHAAANEVVGQEREVGFDLVVEVLPGAPAEEGGAKTGSKTGQHRGLPCRVSTEVSPVFC